MSVKDRIDDSKLLFDAGKLEGSLISVLLAVAATSRKRYPRAEGKRDGEAFEQFLIDERDKITGGVAIHIEFKETKYTLEQILYKFVRNCLVHEAELDEYISFDYGDFLLDKRGTKDYFTFSSELVIRLAYIVEKADENKDLFSGGRYCRLPAPTDLSKSAVIKYKWDNQHFEVVCVACSVITEVWDETGELLTWLHFQGRQCFDGQLGKGTFMKMLVPTKYITSIESIENGPNFKRVKKRTNGDIGIFPPHKSSPDDSIDFTEIEMQISKLQIPQKKATITVSRPHYEVDT